MASHNHSKKLDSQASSALKQLTPNLSARNSAEVQLLLACSRTTVDAETSDRIRSLLGETLDWEFIVERARLHCVLPLVYQSLYAVGTELVPKDILLELRDYSAENARFNLYRAGELVKLLRLLKAHNIPALPFKGPVLSNSAYGSLALRQYGDLDVLVNRDNVLRTKALLLSQGYRVPTVPNARTDAGPFQSRDKDLIFDSADGRVRVELHWQLAGRYFRYPLDIERLWHRLETTTLAGTPILTLATEDLLLYLCMHGSKHGWERLLWICDVAELVQKQQNLNWRTVTDQAYELGCERMLALGLLLAKDLLGTSLSHDVWEMIHIDSRVKNLSANVQDSLFLESDAQTGISHWYGLHLRVRERLRDRMRLRIYRYRNLMRLVLLPNSVDRAIVPLPRRLSFIYYLLRPMRVLKGLGVNRLKQMLKPSK